MDFFYFEKNEEAFFSYLSRTNHKSDRKVLGRSLLFSYTFFIELKKTLWYKYDKLLYSKCIISSSYKSKY